MAAPSEAKTADASMDEYFFSEDVSLHALQETYVVNKKNEEKNEEKKTDESIVAGMSNLGVDDTKPAASDVKSVEEVAPEPDVKRARVRRVVDSTAAAPDVPCSEWHVAKSERVAKVSGFKGTLDDDIYRRRGRAKQLQTAVATKFPSLHDVTQAELRRLKGTKEPRKVKRPSNDLADIKAMFEKIKEKVTPDFRADQSTSALYLRFLVSGLKESSMWTVPIPNIEVTESDRQKIMTMYFPNCFSLLENINVFFADLPKDMKSFHQQIVNLGRIIHALPEGCVTMQMWVGFYSVERA